MLVAETMQTKTHQTFTEFFSLSNNTNNEDKILWCVNQYTVHYTGLLQELQLARGTSYIKYCSPRQKVKCMTQTINENQLRGWVKCGSQILLNALSCATDKILPSPSFPPRDPLQKNRAYPGVGAGAAGSKAPSFRLGQVSPVVAV